ncbi:unnamed protein product [Arabis nemorensis]|uniref:Uncharacterized protein n=1 Tax=Arabis nemorensis TaxID=586526 RepID=A0A565CAY8_9BRAS|nr:unnamed protein product [Arabis nemorensis]
MLVSRKALEKRLRKAGKDLLDPPTSSSPNSPSQRELSEASSIFWVILSELFLCLTEVHQDPPSSTTYAPSPVMKALFAPRLFEHSDVDVKVSVAACITHIMRITAPEAPYSDDMMQRIEILDIVAKAKVYVVMLDLGCDALLTEMFQHSLKALRDDHPMKVFLSMETIMTVVLEESEDIPPELLSPILDYVKKDDEIPQVSQRLAEQVLSRSASKLKTCLAEAVKASGVSLDKYSNLVASICEGTFSEKIAEVSTPEQTCVHAANSSINKNGHEAVSPRRETVAGVETRKRARVENCRLHEAHHEMGKTPTAEGEPSCRNHKSSAEPEHKKLPKPGSVSDQLAKVKQSIVDTITSVRQFRSELETKEQSIVDILTSVRQFRSEIKQKEDNLEASLQEVDILGEKIMGINKILNS